MWTYNKILQYPVNIKCTDPRLAKVIISQYGGPDGELAASLRYLSQRFAMPDQNAKAILNDIGTEELAHLEMVGSIVHQITKNASIEEIEAAGLGSYYTDHGVGLEYLLIHLCFLFVFKHNSINTIVKNKLFQFFFIICTIKI